MVAQRVAIIGDTHGWIDPRVLKVVRDCDLILHAGDVGGAHVLHSLRQTGQTLHAVRGNNDNVREWKGQGVRALDDLPPHQIIDLPGGTVALIHGHRSGALKVRHDRLRKRFSHCRAVVCGHSHRQSCDMARDPWVLNPGAGGKFRTYGGASMLVLSISGETWDVEAIRYYTRKRAQPPLA
jgi:putative phosphoesterase